LTDRVGSMRRAGSNNPKSSRVMLGLLDAVGRDRAPSQRDLASELGVALGLVNAYLRWCMKKGLVKVRRAPARRHDYYLTPQGLAEKSRLTVEYLSNSFSLFRQAKSECSDLFRLAKVRGQRNFLLLGQSDLADIAALCAIKQGCTIVGLVEPDAEEGFIGAPTFRTIDAVDVAVDAVLVTDLKNPRLTCERAMERLGVERVLVPELLRVSVAHLNGVAK